MTIESTGPGGVTRSGGPRSPTALVTRDTDLQYIRNTSTGAIEGLYDARTNTEAPIPVIQTDASGNTVLVGADGNLSFTGGTITVGVNGTFPTLQAAVDSIATADCFVELTGADLTGYPTTCNSWAQGFSQMGTSTSNPFSILRYREGRMWVRADSDTRMYPLEAISGSSASDKIYLRHTRFEADISTPQALHVYEEHPVTILMLDSSDVGCTFTTPISVIIKAASDCKIDSINFAAVEYGSIEISDGAVVSYFASDAAGLAALTAAMWLLKFTNGGSLHTITADGLELWNFGTIIIDDTDMLQNAYHGLSHYLLGNLAGDLIIKEMRYEVICLDSTAPVYPQFSSMIGRNLVVDGVKVLLRDPGSKVAALALFNFKDNFIWARYSVSNISFQSQFANSTCVCAVIDEDLTLSGSAVADGATIYLTSISFDPANFSSAAKRKAYKTTTGGSNRNVVVSGLSNCSADRPSTGSLTVSDTRLGTQSTGAGTALLGTNCPAVTVSAPYAWKAVVLADGSTGYVPVWK